MRWFEFNLFPPVTMLPSTWPDDCSIAWLHLAASGCLPTGWSDGPWCRVTGGLGEQITQPAPAWGHILGHVSCHVDVLSPGAMCPVMLMSSVHHMCSPHCCQAKWWLLLSCCHQRCWHSGAPGGTVVPQGGQGQWDILPGALHILFLLQPH